MQCTIHLNYLRSGKHTLCGIQPNLQRITLRIPAHQFLPITGIFGGAGLQANTRMLLLHTGSSELNPNQVGCQEIICIHPSSASG